MSMSARVAFKWLHISLKSSQLTAIHHTNGWLVSLAMDLAALCDMWW